MVAIVSILAALLLPSLGKAKERAKAMGCINNLRQQGIAFQLFASDHDAAAPTAFSYPFPEGIGQYLYEPYRAAVAGAPGNGYTGYSGQGQAWQGNPWGSVKPCPMFICPAVRTPAGDTSELLGCQPNSAYLHYAMGMWLTYFYNFDTPNRIDLNQFDDLAPFTPDTNNEFSKSFQFFSGQPIANYPAVFYASKFCLVADSDRYWYNNGARNGGTTRYRHFDKANCLMLDGSVRAVKQLSNYGFEVLQE